MRKTKSEMGLMEKFMKTNPPKSKNYAVLIWSAYRNKEIPSYCFSLYGGNKKTHKIVEEVTRKFLEKLKRINNKI